MRGEWDVITATNEGDLVWQRYGDGVIVVARPGEHPDDALARHIEREKRDQGNETWVRELRRLGGSDK
jgi:hypothetical protein